MKAQIVAAATALLVGGATAKFHHGHSHKDLFAKREANDAETCVPGCTTIYTTITGPAGLVFPSTTSSAAPVTTTSVPATTSTAPATVPTLQSSTCSVPGTYTFPATTIVVTETTTVCGASTTTLPSGTHTVGGVTTVVETETTFVCPYATTKTESGVVTSTIESTTYICPSAGTYTIAPITVTVTDTSSVVPVPVISTFVPGTYTAPAVTTIVETSTVIYCPFAAQATATSSAEAVAATTVSSAEAVATSSAAATPSSSPSSSSSSSSSSSLGNGGDVWAITYTPYDSTGACKSQADVLTDITSIAQSGFKSVRVYSTDCDTLPNVGAACQALGLKMILGVFIGEVGCDNGSPHVADQVSAIVAWADWSLVELVAVGNEAMFNGYCSVEQLTSLVVSVKSQLGGAGYSGPFTTTDVVSAWQESDVSGLCAVIDYVATNAHAYFNAATLPEAAGAFVASQLAIVEGICNLPGLVLESGWPTKGTCNGDACPGTQEQAIALASIVSTIGSKVAFFTFGTDMWKAPGDCECEQYFNSIDYFGSSS